MPKGLKRAAEVALQLDRPGFGVASAPGDTLWSGHPQDTELYRPGQDHSGRPGVQPLRPDVRGHALQAQSGLGPAAGAAPQAGVALGAAEVQVQVEDLGSAGRVQPRAHLQPRAPDGQPGLTPGACGRVVQQDVGLHRLRQSLALDAGAAGEAGGWQAAAQLRQVQGLKCQVQGAQGPGLEGLELHRGVQRRLEAGRQGRGAQACLQVQRLQWAAGGEITLPGHGARALHGPSALTGEGAAGVDGGFAADLQVLPLEGQLFHAVYRALLGPQGPPPGDVVPGWQLVDDQIFHAQLLDAGLQREGQRAWQHGGFARGGAGMEGHPPGLQTIGLHAHPGAGAKPPTPLRPCPLQALDLQPLAALVPPQGQLLRCKVGPQQSASRCRDLKVGHAGQQPGCAAFAVQHRPDRQQAGQRQPQHGDQRQLPGLQQQACPRSGRPAQGRWRCGRARWFGGRRRLGQCIRRGPGRRVEGGLWRRGLGH